MNVTISDELAGAFFNDDRLTSRLGAIGKMVGDQPNKSLPAAAAGGRADIEGAYRFFNNKKVTPEGILAPHYQNTLERIRTSESEFAIIAQDTSKADLTRRDKQVVGAGKLGGESKSGLYLHPLVVFTETNVPLGVVGHCNFIRKKIDKAPQAEKSKRRRELPIEEKESYRWLQGIDQARKVAEQCLDKKCIVVQDSEADINDVLAQPRTLSNGKELHIIVRNGQARSTSEGDLYESVKTAPVCFQMDISVSARKSKVKCTSHKREQDRPARQAAVEVRAKSVTLTPKGHPPLQYNMVLVDEISPPAEGEPIRWLLITSLPIDTNQQINQVIAAYCTRWQIEIFFRTLKSGCRIENRQFRNIEPIENAIALYMVVAWRVMYLCMLGRECPDISCELIFEPCEWKSVYTVLGKEIPEEPPTLNQVIRTISRLGGFIDRAKSVPGPETLWKGIQVANCYALAWLAFGPGST